jgi:NADH:ubiquinone oxidoreductase subunit F (NADH-binding)
VVHVPAADECPVARTAAIIEVLAAESAGQCGPCRFGLPRLSDAVGELAAGTADRSEVERLAAMVDGRGACAHPDGTVRLVRSLLTVVPLEVAQHARGRCTYGEPGRPWRAGEPVAS